MVQLRIGFPAREIRWTPLFPYPEIMLQELAARVLELYSQADQAVARFQSLSGLRCPPGCSACCHSEKVEATMLELLPLAFHLFSTNQAELLIKRLEKQPDPRRCILFRPDLSEPGGGGCSQYPFRAMVCRLFGFAGTNDRLGSPRLAHCRVMRKISPPPAEGRRHRDELPNIVLFYDYGIAITSLHLDFGTIRRPINIAIREALLKVGLFLELTASSATCQRSDQPPAEPPGTPFRPRRAA